MNNENLEIIETIVPIPLDTLKLYFENKNTFFLIDYGKSNLRGEKFLTYIGNLDIPCDIVVDTEENFREIYSCYLKHEQIVSLPLLEHITIDLLLEKRGIIEEYHTEYLEIFNDDLEQWEDILESLLLYNFYTLESKEIKDFVTTNHPHNDTDSLRGINFISLLKYEFFYEFYKVQRNKLPSYYSKYFNEYMFKGNNLYHYWAHPQNLFHVNLLLISSNTIGAKDMYDGMSESYRRIRELEENLSADKIEEELEK
jgi:hypothetical protein